MRPENKSFEGDMNLGTSSTLKIQEVESMENREHNVKGMV